MKVDGKLTIRSILNENFSDRGNRIKFFCLFSEFYALSAIASSNIRKVYGLCRGQFTSSEFNLILIFV